MTSRKGGRLLDQTTMEASIQRRIKVVWVIRIMTDSIELGLPSDILKYEMNGLKISISEISTYKAPLPIPQKTDGCSQSFSGVFK
ncbi:hypothetical protein CDAR_291461 [Caerostris darwini]|uniref:Uncharacterized protein n=1 Tax=Caerostris darwini TaxID=1538125 RepID=A0AAV4RLK3_9ARAC|nr:hypothetical protein CDAR_291461 [Caerostris darwini]